MASLWLLHDKSKYTLLNSDLSDVDVCRFVGQLPDPGLCYNNFECLSNMGDVAIQGWAIFKENKKPVWEDHTELGQVIFIEQNKTQFTADAMKIAVASMVHHNCVYGVRMLWRKNYGIKYEVWCNSNQVDRLNAFIYNKGLNCFKKVIQPEKSVPK